MEKLKSILTEGAVILVILFIVSIAAIVDFKLKDSNSASQEIKDMYSSLQQEKKEITYLGNDIKKGAQELKSLKDKMNTIQPGGGDEWNHVVIQYNSKLNEYNEKMNEYSEKVKSYDEKYSQYQKIKQKNENLIKWFKDIIGIIQID